MSVYCVKRLLRISVHMIVFAVYIDIVANMGCSNNSILKLAIDYYADIARHADSLYEVIEFTVNEIAMKLTMMIA